MSSAPPWIGSKVLRDIHLQVVGAADTHLYNLGLINTLSSATRNHVSIGPLSLS